MLAMKKVVLLALAATSASAFAFSPRAASVGTSSRSSSVVVPPVSKSFAK